MTDTLAPLRTPAALFVALWTSAVAWSGPQRAAARPQSARFQRSARAALLGQHDATTAYQAVQSLIGASAHDEATFRGQVLSVMHAIDEAFYLVHPRAVSAPASTGVRVPLPDWLRDARDQRLMTGSYLVDSGRMLIPRGPLLRGARHPAASSADSLADRFAALSVVSPSLEQDGRPIQVEVKIIPPSVGRGVPPGKARGAETVAFVPIAEAADDIVARERSGPGQSWVDFRPSPSVDAKTLILDALSEAGTIDLAIAPEFMVCEAHADELAAALAANPRATRLLVAGTGPTLLEVDGQPWNEARAVNGTGADLWRQRKLWPAGIDGARATTFGLSPSPSGGLTYEDTAGGDRLIVSDIDSLGRCVILICQDLQAQLLAENLMIQYQPDWVFAPLLDSGVGENRWMHQRAFALSALAQTRFVIVSSTSLAAKAGYPAPACGLAVGPQAPSDFTSPAKDTPSAFQVAHADTKGGARLATIQWRHGRWLKTKLATDPAPAA